MNEERQRRLSVLWCAEHESLNDPCDGYLLEFEVEGYAKPCRVVRATLTIHELAKVRVGGGEA